MEELLIIIPEGWGTKRVRYVKTKSDIGIFYANLQEVPTPLDDPDSLYQYPIHSMKEYGKIDQLNDSLNASSLEESIERHPSSAGSLGKHTVADNLLPVVGWRKISLAEELGPFPRLLQKIDLESRIGNRQLSLFDNDPEND